MLAVIWMTKKTIPQAAQMNEARLSAMTMRHHFLEIKRLFFPRWDRDNHWRVSKRSKRRLHGHCDTERRVIEIVIQYSDPDKRDKLLIHEICHAVADMGHGRKWQARMEKAAQRADQLGRHRLAELLREEIVGVRRRAMWSRGR